MPMLVLYSNNSGDPIPNVSDSVYLVLLDNWDEEIGPWPSEPNMPPNLLTARDATALANIGISELNSVGYLSLQYVRANSPDFTNPIMVEVRATSRDFFEMFEVPMEFGQVWTAESDRTRANVVVISSGLNKSLFGGSDSTGRDLKVGGETYEIVGVLSPWNLTPRVYSIGFNAGVEGVFLPLSQFKRESIKPSRVLATKPIPAEEFDERFLASEVLFAQLWIKLNSNSELREYENFVATYVLEQQTNGRFPGSAVDNRLYSAKEWLEVSPDNKSTKRLYIALAMVGGLFLIVCLSNLISLLLSKFLGNLKSTSVLRALGIARYRIFQLYLTEVAILGLAGGFLSVGISMVVLELMQWLYLSNLPPELKQLLMVSEGARTYMHFDNVLFATTLAVAISSICLVALIPAFKVSNEKIIDHLRTS